jgi:hypothetical protein
MVAEFGADTGGIDNALPWIVQRPCGCIFSNRLTKKLHNLRAFHRLIIGDVVDAPIAGRRVQRKHERLSDIGVMHQLNPFVGIPVAEPPQPFLQMRIAFTVHERQAQNAQAQPMLPVRLAERAFGGHFADRIGLARLGFVVLAGGPATAGAIHQVGAHKHKAINAGMHGGLGQCNSSICRDRPHLSLVAAAKKRRKMYHRADIGERLRKCIRLQQIASYHLSPALAQRFGSLRLAHQDANGIAAIEQARHKTATHPSGRSGNKNSHMNTSRWKGGRVYGVAGNGSEAGGADSYL